MTVYTVVEEGVFCRLLLPKSLHEFLIVQPVIILIILFFFFSNFDICCST